ncbi:hypothetical protein [Moraxella marmotae]|uniref:hypothetical protein n=1 Tax=Moraxella marmotae TaxID=3344520 RepID=UPI0035D47D1D
MKFIKTTASVMAAIVMLTGCAATKNILAKRDNGSLDYRSVQPLAPLKLPADQPAAAFTPLYQVPQTQAELPNFINESGKQYQLPRPPNAR